MVGGLHTQNLSLWSGGRLILSGITLDLPSASVLALVGPNGSGKSTLLRCLAGLWKPSDGQVFAGAIPVQKLRRTDVARLVSYVPQETKLELEFTVRETVLMGRYAHRGRFEWETAQDRMVADEALARVDAAHLADRPVTQLSGGERQRVLIARSLAAQSHVLLLDEPTANLDVDHSLDVLDLCRSLAGDGHTIVVATHDLNAVYRFVDRVALLDRGQLIAIGRPETVLTADNLERAFHVRAEALKGAGGTPALLFHRILERGSSQCLEN